METNTNTNTETKPKNIWAEIAERALRTGANVPVVEVEFDREKALHGLAWNYDRNRRPKPKVIANFRHIIDDFNFAAGSMLRIAQNDDGEWVLIDGQHRLTAIAESGAKLWLLVAVDERPARIAYASIDNVGTLRSRSDAISSLLGWSTKHWTSICGAAEIISDNFSTTSLESGVSKGSASAAKKLEIVCGTMEKYKEAIIAISSKKYAKASVIRATACAAHIVCAHYVPDVFWPYFNEAVNDDMLAKNSPEKKLTETFLMGAVYKEDRFQLFYYTVACWNAKYTKVELPKFPAFLYGAKKKSLVPQILGTPYPK